MYKKGSFGEYVNPIPVGITLFIVGLYLSFAGSLILTEENVVVALIKSSLAYVVFYGFTHFFVKLVKHFTNYRGLSMDKLTKAVDTITKMFVVTVFLTKLTSHYSLFEVKDADSAFAISMFLMIILSGVYVCWYILFGKQR